MTFRALLPMLALVIALVLPATASAYDVRHVFITNRGGGNIVELDDTLTYERTWFAGTTFDGAALSAPNGMAFTPDGSLFVADTFNDRIVALDASGGFLRSFSTLARMGTSIESIYFDGAGVLYASSNPGLGVVARFSQSGTDLADVVSAPAFLNLGNVNLTEAGNVIVSDFSGMGRGLREIDPATGAVLRTFGEDLARQEDVMIDGADRVFVSHYEADEIVVYGPAPARAELYRFAAPAGAALPLVRPTGIALTHDCALVIASFTNGGIFVFRHRGDLAPTFERVLRPGEEIPAEAALAQVESIAVSGLGLPGSFDEFADHAPSCDPPVPVDAGATLDAGTTPSPDAATVEDAAMPRVDSGAVRAPAAEGCACRAAGAPGMKTPFALAAMLAALGLVMRRRRWV